MFRILRQHPHKRRFHLPEGGRAAMTTNALMATAVDRLASGAVTWPVASGSLLVGFGVAQATGVRPLGAIVLALGAGWCALRWRLSVGTGRVAALVGAYLALFVLSHVIAGPLGTWPAVLLVTATMGVATLLVADVPAARAADS
jgi:hypothetical protein